jgi:hypothetical protein
MDTYDSLVKIMQDNWIKIDGRRPHDRGSGTFVTDGAIMLNSKNNETFYGIVNGRFCKRISGHPIDTILSKQETDILKQLVLINNLK